MGRLDELDLSKKLTREEEQSGLERGWARLAYLRPATTRHMPDGT